MPDLVYATTWTVHKDHEPDRIRGLHRAVVVDGKAGAFCHAKVYLFRDNWVILSSQNLVDSPLVEHAVVLRSRKLWDQLHDQILLLDEQRVDFRAIVDEAERVCPAHSVPFVQSCRKYLDRFGTLTPKQTRHLERIARSRGGKWRP